ncbi:phage antirepressor KilAC domain-containing protein [uncultured Bacteroides sp.]|uniref:phage antirepressor KilAC domain-containing protein n=1 Tax=uncultured Bacteroides sp. TaxID=162156 RepID=UPI0025FF5349|nr:phage antirepressor KilAC domain-containing protein [uncultured Bacteroides sp.]
MTNEIFTYQGSEITFQLESGSMKINASQMAMVFGDKKRPAFWLRTKQAKDYIQALTDVHICTSADLLIVTKGGSTEQGTWMHEDLALEFARWLNPMFGVWCNHKVKELLRKGTTSLSPEEQAMLSRSNEQLSILKKQIAENKPMLEFAEAVLEDGESISIGALSLMLTDNGCNIGRNTLYRFLREYGFVCKGKGGSYNMPTRQYSNKGLLCIKYPKQDENNTRPRKITLRPVTYVTTEGVQYFLRNKDIILAFLKADKLKRKNKQD